MFKEKAKQIVKDILQSMGQEDDPIKTLMEPYVEKQLQYAYNMGLDSPQNKSK